ncbi:MAG: transposase-like protein [Sulfitobacter sp.]|jgi:transposase-like protein
MRYAASEKLEIIRLVEESHLSARLTLAKLGIPRTTFYRWYDRYLQRGEAGLQDQSPKPKHVWNRVPDEVRRKVVDFALQETELSPRELAVTFTDQERYFVSESTVYRVLKAHDVITSPAFIVMKAASEFKDKTTGINQLWQTDFTYIKVLGWGWLYLSTVLDDYSRYIVSWKLCTTARQGIAQQCTRGGTCELKTLPIRSTSHCGHPAATKFTSFKSPMWITPMPLASCFGGGFTWVNSA